VTKELKVFVNVVTKTLDGTSQLSRWTVTSAAADGGFKRRHQRAAVVTNILRSFPRFIQKNEI
jgi:hypothetical protein